VEGRLKPRDILSLRIIFDHDVIDGALATWFTRKLVGLVESGYGLNQDQSPATFRQPQPNKILGITSSSRKGFTEHA
jgi:hypothetical protein